jgi:hypothetical protein
LIGGGEYQKEKKKKKKKRISLPGNPYHAMSLFLDLSCFLPPVSSGT